MTYSYRMAGRQIVVNATGEIMPNETELMTQWTVTLPVAIQHTPIAAFVFNSTGGNVLEAKRLAVAIRNGDEHPNTGVAAGGMCASACVLLWAAGAHKSVAADSRVGVHMTSLGDDASQTSLLLNGMIGRDLASVGAPASVVAAAVATPGDFDLLAHAGGFRRLERQHRRFNANAGRDGLGVSTGSRHGSGYR